MNDALKLKTLVSGSLGNSPHKFLQYNRTHEEFAELTKGKEVGEARVQGRWMLIPLKPGYVLVLGECDGKVLHHPAGPQVPKKVHLRLDFDGGSLLSATTQMWGAYQLYERGEEQNRDYVKDMRPTPHRARVQL